MLPTSDPDLEILREFVDFLVDLVVDGAVKALWHSFFRSELIDLSEHAISYVK